MADALETPTALPPHIQLIQMGIASFAAAALYTAARMSIADHIGSGVKTAAELAGPTGTHAPTLYRFLRSLSNFGVVNEHHGQRFSLTPLGQALRADAPGSARSTLLAFCGPTFSRTWEELPYSLETGKTAFDKAFGMGFFEYLSRHPDDASHFSAAMVGYHGPETPAVAEAYDFSGIGTLVDVGGATGNMLAAVLTRHRHLRGVLFDRPYVVKEAPALLAARGVADRVSIQAGNFFQGVPPGGDAYLLSHIIHDWSEEQCVTILGHCRRAIGPRGRVLIVETVLPADGTPHAGKMQDLVMLMFPGGMERTEAEYADLLRKADLRLNRVIPTASIASIVEAVPV
jgi:hypothetical protein